MPAHGPGPRRDRARARLGRAASAAPESIGTLTPGHAPWPVALWPAVGLTAAALALFHSADPDFWFHLAAGRSILEHGLPRQETWCVAALGDTPWTPEWLFHVMLFLTRRVGGDLAVAVWRAGLASGAVLLALVLARRLGSGGWPALLLGPLALAVQRPRMVARGEQWLSVLALVYLLAFERARRGERDRTPWLLALQVVWANAHPSWIAGPAISALYALAAALGLGFASRDLRRGARWGLLAVALAAAGVLTPHPLATLTEPVRLVAGVHADPLTQSIDELQRWSWTRDAGDPFTAFLALCGAAALLGGARAFRASPPLAVAAVASVAMGLLANRFGAMATLVAWPALAVALSGRSWRRNRLGAARWVTACVAAIAGIFFLARDRGMTEPGIAPQWRSFPVRAVAIADSLGFTGPVLNTFEYGGYILNARGDDHPPLIDGRARGSAAFRSRFARAMVDPAAHDSLVSSMPFTHALVRPPRAKEDILAVGLARRPGWELVFVDDAAYLFVNRRRPPSTRVPPAYRLLTPDYPRMSSLCVAARDDSALAGALEGELERARAESPWHARASYWLAMLALTRGRARETLALLDEAERIRPTLPGLKIPRGIAWDMLGDRPAARRWVKRALHDPETAEAAREILSRMR